MISSSVMCAQPRHRCRHTAPWVVLCTTVCSRDRRAGVLSATRDNTRQHTPHHTTPHTHAHQSDAGVSGDAGCTCCMLCCCITSKASLSDKVLRSITRGTTWHNTAGHGRNKEFIFVCLLSSLLQASCARTYILTHVYTRVHTHWLIQCVLYNTHTHTHTSYLQRGRDHHVIHHVPHCADQTTRQLGSSLFGVRG